jgi:hypothetical protein
MLHLACSTDNSNPALPAFLDAARQVIDSLATEPETLVR